MTQIIEKLNEAIKDALIKRYRSGINPLGISRLDPEIAKACLSALAESDLDAVAFQKAWEAGFIMVIGDEDDYAPIFRTVIKAYLKSLAQQRKE